MTRISATHPVGDGASLTVNYDTDRTWFTIGAWIVEVADGKLIVRGQFANAEVLRIDAGDWEQ